MAGNPERSRSRRWNRWRAAGWGGAAAFLLLPLVAMQFADEVNWGLADFVLAGALVGGVGLTYELVARRSGNGAYRAAVGVALAGAFILVWTNLAVGILGSEENPASLMYTGCSPSASSEPLPGACWPIGMARALLATTVAQLLVAVIALIAGSGFTGSMTLYFVVFWVTTVDGARRYYTLRNLALPVFPGLHTAPLLILCCPLSRCCGGMHQGSRRSIS
jgi:hypothetical protein